MSGYIYQGVHIVISPGIAQLPLHQKFNSRLACHPSYPEIVYINLKDCDWGALYGGSKGEIPTNAPKPRGKILACFYFLTVIMQGTTWPEGLGPDLWLM